MEVAKERIQDMIIGALNPMIDGLRAEVQVAGSRPFWLPNGNRFEYFYPLSDYVQEEDLLEDLESRFPDVRQVREKHDRDLEILRSALLSGFEAARCCGDIATTVEELLRAEPQASAFDTEFVLARIVEGAGEISSNYSLAKYWNPRADGLRAVFAAKLPDHKREVERAFAGFMDSARRALDHLKEIRLSLADKYGLRIRPVERPAGW
jgi:hypothetical protein